MRWNFDLFRTISYPISLNAKNASSLASISHEVCASICINGNHCSSYFISPETGALVIQDNLRIGAAIIAIIVAYYTRSTVATIISGLCVIWLLTFWQ
ncbi:MAG: hypothetical protein GWP24_08245 [Alphaproteobacteria bacterium]|nr:hypothetical protein [Alphaproteobacteria bacterium]